jgi:hypothetical protein
LRQKAKRQYGEGVAHDISLLQNALEIGAREMLLVAGEEVLDNQCCDSLRRFAISLQPIVQELTELRALIALWSSRAVGSKKESRALGIAKLPRMTPPVTKQASRSVRPPRRSE